MALNSLSTLMGSYYHQDFDHTDGGWSPLRDFLRDMQVEQVRSLVQEIDQVQARDQDEAQLDAFLDALGNHAFQESYRAWLSEIRRRAQQHLDGHGVRR